MHIRDINLGDLVAVEKFYGARDYQLPNINNGLYFVQKTILDDGEIIGAAFAHLTSEVTLILDESRSKLTRSKAIKMVFSSFLAEISNKGLEDTHVFISPESNVEYAEFLKKHFNFIEAKGLPMYFQKR
jgi:hypothetical protein